MDSKRFGYQKRLDLVFVCMLQGEGKEKEVMLGFLTLEAKIGNSSHCIENALNEDCPMHFNNAM